MAKAQVSLVFFVWVCSLWMYILEYMWGHVCIESNCVFERTRIVTRRTGHCTSLGHGASLGPAASEAVAGLGGVAVAVAVTPVVCVAFSPLGGKRDDISRHHQPQPSRHAPFVARRVSSRRVALPHHLRCLHHLHLHHHHNPLLHHQPTWSQSAIPPLSSAMSSTRQCRPSWTRCSTRRTLSSSPYPPPLPLDSRALANIFARDRDVSEAFHDLLPKRQFADYYKLIKHPQALNPVQVGKRAESWRSAVLTDGRVAKSEAEDLHGGRGLCEGLCAGTCFPHPPSFLLIKFPNPMLRVRELDFP